MAELQVNLDEVKAHEKEARSLLLRTERPKVAKTPKTLKIPQTNPGEVYESARP